MYGKRSFRRAPGSRPLCHGELASLVLHARGSFQRLRNRAASCRVDIATEAMNNAAVDPATVVNHALTFSLPTLNSL
jgi:hypothetical protein